MSKEIYISSTPHETRLAIVENDELTEIYYERENEYTLAGSIYNGKVTRVLPGMQSSFVDIGLERDAFLYITDFMEEAGDTAEFDHGDPAPRAPRTLEGNRDSGSRDNGPRENGNRENGRGDGRRDRNPNYVSERNQEQTTATPEGDIARASEGRDGEFGNRGERNDRGGRGRGRGRGRDRNAGSDRTSQSDATPRFAAPAPTEFEERPILAPVSDDLGLEAPADATLGEGAPGADGSRRWRGRRGRRRGRGNRPDEVVSATPADATLAAPDAPAFEPVFDGEEFDEPSSFDIDGSAAEPVTETQIQPLTEAHPAREDRGRGERGGRDRNDRNDRGGRGEQRPPRVPRGFAPRGQYVVDPATDPEQAAYPAEALDSAPAVEPLILPGESLGKYRKDATESSTPAAGSTASTAAPDYDFKVSGWDGGAVLPGETIRPRGGSAPVESRDSDRNDRGRGDGRRDGRRDGRGDRNNDRGPRRDDRGDRVDRSAQFSAPSPVVPMVVPAYEPAIDRQSGGPVSGYVHAGPGTEEIVAHQPAHILPDPTVEAVVHEHVEAVQPKPEQEYEPEEASASYRVDPVAPSEYRQSAPFVEEPAVEEPTAEPAHHLEVSPSGEVFAPEPHAEPIAPEEPRGSIHALFAAEELIEEPIPADQADEEEISEPLHPMGTGNFPAPAASVTEHDVTTIEPTGDMLSEPTPPAAEPQHFAPGHGDLEEDFLEEEELDTTSIQARADHLYEHIDDTEQEPLEGAADLGTMIREMSIDHITRTEPAVTEDDDEDFEDFEEDTLEEDAFSESPSAEDDEDFAEGQEEQADTDDFQQSPDTDPSYTPSAEARPEGRIPSSPNGDVRRRREGGRGRDRGRGRGDRERSGNREASPSSGNRESGSYERSSPERSNSERTGPDRSGLGERARNTGGGGDRDRGRSSGRGRQSMQATNLPAISDLLKPGQELLCQIAKEPIAKKGARITSHIALPGRFLVFMPTVGHTGVSRKIESDAERRRLKEILLSEKGEAAGGFIVRTAASGASEEELRSDLRFLLNLWTDIKQRSESSKSPALIYHDLNLVERILRDQVTDNFSAIWVDTENEYERVLRFLQRFQPSLIRRVKLYTKETPLFEQFGITEEINKALRSKVWLKSGGSIVINQTEALVAIDINTGKFVGKTARLEDTIVKTNLDAIPEIVRQIRLRDLGGIIIIDFIDMDERKNRNRVMQALEDELKNDRAPSKVLPFNDFGLVAITRKRVKQSLERTLSTTCNVCTGTGMVKSPVTVCNDIYVEMRKMHKHLDRGDVMLRVHPEVVKQLKLTGSKWLQEMEEMCGKTILIKSDPSLHPEQFDIH